MSDKPTVAAPPLSGEQFLSDNFGRMIMELAALIDGNAMKDNLLAQARQREAAKDRVIAERNERVAALEAELARLARKKT